MGLIKLLISMASRVAEEEKMADWLFRPHKTLLLWTNSTRAAFDLRLSSIRLLSSFQNPDYVDTEELKTLFLCLYLYRNRYLYRQWNGIIKAKALARLHDLKREMLKLSFLIKKEEGKRTYSTEASSTRAGFGTLQWTRRWRDGRRHCCLDSKYSKSRWPKRSFKSKRISLAVCLLERDDFLTLCQVSQCGEREGHHHRRRPTNSSKLSPSTDSRGAGRHQRHQRAMVAQLCRP